MKLFSCRTRAVILFASIFALFFAPLSQAAVLSVHAVQGQKGDTLQLNTVTHQATIRHDCGQRAGGGQLSAPYTMVHGNLILHAKTGVFVNMKWIKKPMTVMFRKVGKNWVEQSPPSATATGYFHGASCSLGLSNASSHPLVFPVLPGIGQ